MSDLVFPTPHNTAPIVHGVFPIDFILETVIRAGLDWYATDSKAPQLVFGHLYSDAWLSKYGPAKVAEITAFINTKKPIKIIQHWSLIAENMPCFSIQLLDGSEDVAHTGLMDYQGKLDTLNINQELTGRNDVGYEPMHDNLHIGIHNSGTPDLTKYLYYLLVYILNAFKPQLEDRGLQLGTFRATDVSRLQEYLPANIFSRFVNVTYFTISTYDKGSVPLLDSITGITLPQGGAAVADNVSRNNLTVSDIGNIDNIALTPTFE